MKKNKFTVDYFIKKFEAIPEHKWIIWEFKDRRGSCCVNGHSGMRNNLWRKLPKEVSGLYDIFSVLELTYTGGHFMLEGCVKDSCFGYSNKAAAINNNMTIEYRQPTPKQRILAALYDIKKMQTPIEKDEVKETIRYVTVEIDKEVKQLTKQQILN